MADSLRDLIAETLAGHRIGLVGVNTWRCSCDAWTGTRSPDVPHESVKAEYERHVAEAILAAIGERLLPEGGETREEWQRFGEIKPCAAWARDRCATEPEVHKRRSVTSWPGGSQFIGPWRPVEETPGGEPRG